MVRTKKLHASLFGLFELTLNTFQFRNQLQIFPQLLLNIGRLNDKFNRLLIAILGCLERLRYENTKPFLWINATCIFVDCM